jgi:hypothetical protein
MTQGDKTPLPDSGAQGILGSLISPSSQTPSPPMKSPEGAPSGGWSMLTRSDDQSIRAEQPEDAQGFSGSTTMPRSIHAVSTPSWTLAHVDHRLNPPNHHVPHLPRYIRGGRILHRGRTNRRQTESSQSNRVLTTTQSSGCALRAEPPREEYRELFLTIVFFLSDEEETSPPTSLDSTKRSPSKSLTLCCNPSIWVLWNTRNICC